LASSDKAKNYSVKLAHIISHEISRYLACETNPVDAPAIVFLNAQADLSDVA